MSGGCSTRRNLGGKQTGDNSKRNKQQKDVIGGKQAGDNSNRNKQQKDVIVSGERSAPESSEIAREIRTKRANDAHPPNAVNDGPLAVGASPNATIKKTRADYLIIKNRTSPDVLTDAIKKMNDAQRQSVREMGFGELLHLDIIDVPPKIAYWILDSFDVKRGEIVLDGNRRVHVNENDVQLIFRFPKGPRPIVKKAKNAKASLAEAWLERFVDKHCKRIRASFVAEDMIREADGGLWFRRQFPVLVTCCLIERVGNCYVSSQILDTFQDVDRVADLNWCGYVMKCLIEHTRAWQENKDKYYTGPSLFITLLYMDRVVLGYRRVPRAVPAIKQWKHSKLLNRQDLEIAEEGFGQGFCDGPCTAAKVVGVVALPVPGGRIDDMNENAQQDMPAAAHGADEADGIPLDAEVEPDIANQP